MLYLYGATLQYQIREDFILKRIIYLPGLFIFLVACSNDKAYRIEGRLSNLDNTTLYVVYETSAGSRIDTLACDEEGDFATFHAADDHLQTITFYYNEREDWFTVYPEAGKTIRVKGDAKYPQLIRAKGSRINNALSEFKKKAETILKEQAHILSNRNDYPISKGEISLQLANVHIELKRLAQDYIVRHPREEASVILINEYFVYPDEVEQAEDLLDVISPELDDYYLVKNLRAQIAKAKTTMIGAKAPSFDVVNIYGKAIAPATFRNKYYILTFTALWCDMCQTEVMMLDDLATRYPKDSLEILLVSLDDELEEVREMVLQDSIKWNLVTDSAGQAIRLLEQYNVNSLPKCFLVDKEGRIKLKTSNGMELKQTVDEIMQSPPSGK
jgi:peroxiredoxin